MNDALLSRIERLLTQPRQIWIFRKGNGLVAVHPSPAVLKGNQEFRIVNTTGENAEVSFLSDLITPKQQTIRPQSPATFAAGPGPNYVEYDVRLASGHLAEGGSKPGAIIDP